MEITSVGMSYNNTLARSETIKQDSAVEQQEVNSSQTNEVSADTFTKSAAADEISKSVASTQSNTTQNTDVAKETENQNAAVNLSAVAEHAAKPSPSIKVNTEVTDTNTNTADNAAAETTANTTETVTSVSEYTAAEIAEYDLNGDGEIDASEEAKMRAAQAKLAVNDEAQDGLSIEQMEAKEAYEIAKNQLLLTDDEPIVNKQI